jgi:hypothetical protein
MVTRGSSSKQEPAADSPNLEDTSLHQPDKDADAKKEQERLEDRQAGEGMVILFGFTLAASVVYLLKHYIWIMVDWLGSGVLQLIGYSLLAGGLVATRLLVHQRFWKFVAPTLAMALCSLMTYTIMEYFKIANPDAYFLSAMGGLMVNAACLLAFEERIFGYLSVINIFGIGALECFFPYLLASYQIDRTTFAWLGLVIGMPAVLKTRWLSDNPMVNKLQEPFFVISYINYLVFSTALSGPIYFPIGGKPEPIWILAVFCTMIPSAVILARTEKSEQYEMWMGFVLIHGLLGVASFFAGCVKADGVVRAWGCFVVSLLGLAVGDFWMHDKVWFWQHFDRYILRFKKAT